MSKAERALVLILRLEGVILLLALPPIFFPTDWMATVHGWLGLGELPRGVIVEYLTRSLSMLYGAWGPLYLFLSGDVRRYQSLIVFMAVLKGLFGLGILLLDLWAGMPWFWTATEGPSIVAVSVVQYVLAHCLPG